MIQTLKNIQIIGLMPLIILMTISCERDVSDDAVPATFPTTPEVYTDAPVSLTDQFFNSFDPNAGANAEAFGTDDNVAFLGSSSIRLDIPAPNDPNGGFIGGIFKDRGEGRNLTSYDALTFWVKASRTAVFDEVGFGTDFEQDKFPVVRGDIPLSTDWRKVIIPIPDPSKLVQEKGMFFFSTGTQSTDGVGFTIWIDEIKFENLGTLAQPEPRIQNGENVVQEGFLDVPVQLTGLTQTFNTETGSNVTVNAASSYFDFKSSNTDVATVDDSGLVSVFGIGEVTISASIAGVEAKGSLTLNVNGAFNFAPEPTRDPDNVISIFSDAYDDIPVSRYNSFFAPFQTTLGGIIPVGSESIISYTELNFVGIVFNEVIFPAEAVPPVDATEMTHLHIDINVQEELQDNARLLLELENFGDPGSVGAFTIDGDELLTDDWVSFDIPLSDFSGLGDRDRIGLLLFNSQIGDTPTISNLFLDNIYFYQED